VSQIVDKSASDTEKYFSAISSMSNGGRKAIANTSPKMSTNPERSGRVQMSTLTASAECPEEVEGNGARVPDPAFVNMLPTVRAYYHVKTANGRIPYLPVHCCCGKWTFLASGEILLLGLGGWNRMQLWGSCEVLVCLPAGWLQPVGCGSRCMELKPIRNILKPISAQVSA
jgi:hypothetical protein